MHVNFHKLPGVILPNWDVDQMLSKITKSFSNETDNYEVFIAPTTEPYWQVYPYTGTIFTRNFSSNFPAESKYVIEQLEKLRASIQKSDFSDPVAYEALMQHQFDFRRVQLIKSVAGVDVRPHIDNGRKFALNIGLRNSNTGTTYVSGTQDKKNFWADNPNSFTMQDGEIYMLNVDAAHAVKSLVDKDSKLDRYLITYKVL